MTRHWPKAKFITRSDRTVFTLGDLPATDTERWVMSRKADVVDAVHGGLITMEDACWRYALTIEEFHSWEIAVKRLDRAGQRIESRPEGSSMSMHEYCAGHRVRVSTASRSGPATTEEFLVMRRHAVEGGESMYTLSHTRDRRQRMTPESELTRSGERAAAI
jgi:hypothetical protein